jgi:large-conductance mechanosensitive channel
MDFQILISNAFGAVVNAVAVFLSIRYMGKAVDRIEKRRDDETKKQ